MTIDAFRKALYERPLAQEERDELTADELFVLVLARKLESLTDAEQQKLKPEDMECLASAGLIPKELIRREAGTEPVAGVTASVGIGQT